MMLRGVIRNRAQEHCFRSLTRFCYNSPCQCAQMQHRLLPDPAEVIEVLKEFDLWCYLGLNPFEAIKDKIVPLDKWFSNHVR